MKKISFMCKFLLVFTLIIVSTVGIVYAKDGNGSGSGKNSGQALFVESANINSGDKDVYTNETFDIVFNKNVVNISVMENNSKCFHLSDEKGDAVAIKVIFPDDQIKPTYKNHVFITPEKELAPNSKYTLIIDKNLTAKNQTNLKNEFKIDFITGEITTDETNPILKELKDDIKTYSTQIPTKSANEESTKETTKKVIEENVKKVNAESKKKNNKIIVYVTVVIAVVLVYIIGMLYRKKKIQKE